MSSLSNSHSRPRLRGWIRGLPFILVPFCVLFGETWLHMQRLDNDYSAAAINGELRALRHQIDRLVAEEARLEAMERINAKAPDLGLVEPGADQIQIVRIAPDPAPVFAPESPLELAALAREAAAAAGDGGAEH